MWVAMGSASTLQSPYTSGYKLALLVNYSIVLCKCFLTNYTLLGLQLHFAWLPFHCSYPHSDPSTPTALQININGFRCLLLWCGPSFGQSPWAHPGGIAFSSLALPLHVFFLSYDGSVLWVQNVDSMYENYIHAIYIYKINPGYSQLFWHTNDFSFPTHAVKWSIWYCQVLYLMQWKPNLISCYLNVTTLIILLVCLYSVMSWWLRKLIVAYKCNFA